VHIDDLSAHNTVEIRGTGWYSTSGEGLHRFVDPLDGFESTCQPADAATANRQRAFRSGCSKHG
jgi:aminopeptidase N